MDYPLGEQKWNLPRSLFGSAGGLSPEISSASAPRRKSRDRSEESFAVGGLSGLSGAESTRHLQAQEQ
jgi:hypothetical protein